MAPNDEEIKAYRQFDEAQKDVNELTREDKVKSIGSEVGSSL